MTKCHLRIWVCSISLIRFAHYKCGQNFSVIMLKSQLVYSYGPWLSLKVFIFGAGYWRQRTFQTCWLLRSWVLQTTPTSYFLLIQHRPGMHKHYHCSRTYYEVFGSMKVLMNWIFVSFCPFVISPAQSQQIKVFFWQSCWLVASHWAQYIIHLLN